MFAEILHANFTCIQKPKFTILTFLIVIVGLFVAALPQLPPRPLFRKCPTCGADFVPDILGKCAMCGS